MKKRLLPLNLQLFAADSGAGDAGSAGNNVSGGTDMGTAGTDAGNASGNGTDGANNQGADNQTNDSADAMKAEIARLNAEMAKQKAALDKATHEASAANKALKAKMTAEEIAAQEKKEADEKAAKELDDLRKEVAKSKTVKSVMGKLGTDEETSSELADFLYGAADIDNALLAIQKAWVVRENALKKEYGKLTPPGAGGNGDNSPEMAAVKRATEIGKAKAAVSETAKKAVNAYLR